MITLTISAKTKNGSRIDLSKGLRSPPILAAIKLHMSAAGSDVRARMVANAPRDTGRLANSHGYAFDQDQLKLFVFNRAAYAPYVHGGRKPGGKMPPPQALYEWCRRHIVNQRIARQLASRVATGLSGKIRKSATKDEQAEARSLAFLVARAIGRRGIPPKPWFELVLRTYGIGRFQKAGELISESLSKLVAQQISQRLASGIGKKEGP
jgi:hypothetical protein